MREMVFEVLSEARGHICAASERGLRVEASCLELLHHEAREALIVSLGPAHITYRIRIRRRPTASPPGPIPQAAGRDRLTVPGASAASTSPSC
jgi:hypothetical protein